jgi:glucosamine--fructose-6-phosphate aminotransferase (isomerizing)
MCGITGVITNLFNTHELIMYGLKQLQNRGYDSAGICTLNDNILKINKYASNSENALILLDRTKELHKHSKIGIGHTRWATHGGKTDVNSHPHISSDKNFALVHNGIIENYKDLKDMLIEEKYTFSSETDSEVIVNLLAYNYKQTRDVIESINLTIGMLHGTWGLAIICVDKPYEIYCTRNGSPLLVGQSDNYAMVVSEQSAFTNLITDYIVLKNMDICVIKTNKSIITIETRHIYKLNKKTHIDFSETPDPYPHWTLKEIYEQTESVKRATGYKGRILSASSVKIGGFDLHMDELINLDNLILLGCGTSYNACMFGLHYFKDLCDFNCIQVIDGADFNISDVPRIGRTGLVLLSQSGETKDLHRCITIAKQNSLFTIGVVNVVDSLISREVDCGCYLNAGREVAVASTKSFTSQCIVLSLMAIWFSQHRNLCFYKRLQYLRDLEQVSADISQLLITLENDLERIIPLFDNQTSCFVLGKGQCESIAHEGSLKIKEISYIHCEGYSTSSLKHGPFALLCDRFPVILIAPDDEHFVKNENAYNEIKSRNANVIWITDKEMKNMENVIKIPTNKTYNSLLSVIPLQMLAYKLSVSKGINPDMPKNLAKVVSVE